MNSIDRKRNMRHLLNWMLVMVFVGSVLILSLLGRMWYGGYQPHLLNEQLSKRQYFEQRCDVFWKQTENYLNRLELPEAVVEKEKVSIRLGIELKKTLSNSVNTEKSTEVGGITSIWKAGTEIVESIKKYYMEKNLLLTEQAELGLSTIEENLNQLVQELCTNPEIEEWKHQREEFQRHALRNVLGIVVLIGFSVVCLIEIQHNKEKALWYVGIGCFLSGLGVLGISVFQFVGDTGDSLMKSSLCLIGCAIGGMECAIGSFGMILSKRIPSLKRML